MGLDLVTKNEYKTYVGITSNNQDAQVSSLISKASDLVKNYCRCSFIDYVNDAKVEIFNGGNKFFLLKEEPVIQLKGVEVSTDYGQNYTDMVEFTDYVLDLTNNSVVYIPGDYFPIYTNGYQVTYTAGYETLPEDLKLAVFDLVTFYIKNDAVTHNLRIPTTQVMQLEYTSASSFPSHIARVLNLYKTSWD